MNWKGRAKLNNSFSSNGMEVKVYRLEHDGSNTPATHEKEFPPQHHESVKNQFTKKGT